MLEEQKHWILHRLPKVLDSDLYSNGPLLEEFESKFAEFCGRKYAVATSSGTSALETTLLAYAYLHHTEEESECLFALIPDMTVPMLQWSVENTFFDPTHCSIGDDFLLDINSLVEDYVYDGADQYHSCDLPIIFPTTGGILNEKVEQFKALKEPFFTIEDASHSHGAKYKGQVAGSFGKVSIFSFYATKVMTTGGEGGMILTDDSEFADYCRRFINQGKPRGSTQVQSKGKNYRLSEVQCLFGLSYLEFFSEIVNLRKEIVNLYHKNGFKSVHDSIDGLEPTWYKFIQRVPYNKANDIEKHMEKEGFPLSLRVHNAEMDSTYCLKTGERRWRYPKSNVLANSHVCLPTNFISLDKAERLSVKLKECLGSLSDSKVSDKMLAWATE